MQHILTLVIVVSRNQVKFGLATMIHWLDRIMKPLYAKCMTVLSIALIAFSLALPLIFMSSQKKQLAPWLFLFCSIHCAMVLVQNEMLKSVIADAYLYYYDTDMYTMRPFGLGTSAIVYIAQFLKLSLNLGFVDLMLLFGILGATTIILLSRWIDESFDGSIRALGLLLCFLPGLHFWTSSTGKDAPMSLGIFLVLLSTINIRKRIWLFSLGALICLLTRPHILIILMAAWAGSHILRNRIPVLRILALIVAIAFIPVAQIIIQNFLNIDILNTNDLSKLVAERQNYFENTFDDGVIYISNPIARIIYFNFNPLFYNASSINSLMSSIENLILIVMMLRVFIGFRSIEECNKTFALFLLLFIVAMVIFQGLGGYNIGLALRQKVMIYPAFIMLILICEQGRAVRRSIQSNKSGQSTYAITKPLIG